MRSSLPVAACLTLLAACSHNVPQHKSSGPDAKIEGAKPIELENNAGLVSGIVTYPGGDRVDWKLIELPAGKRGRLDLAMSWKTPRPGLQLMFDVFDEFNTPIVLKPTATRRSREASIDSARGKYFVRVYAKRRGDAGQYKMRVEFHEQTVAPPPPEPDIPLPPVLAEVPRPVCPKFNVEDDTCKKVCDPTAPAGWPGCPPGSGPGGAPPPKCPVFNTQDPTCKSVCDPTAPPNWPGCPKAPPPPPVTVRITKIDVVGSTTAIVIATGSDQKVTAQWTAILVDSTGHAVPNGAIKITRINKTSMLGTVGLISGTVSANPYVKLTPPTP
ncbi:MAG: hypothetical protein WKG01_10410 [Kofleriaceae bacterium]